MDKAKSTPVAPPKKEKPAEVEPVEIKEKPVPVP